MTYQRINGDFPVIEIGLEFPALVSSCCEYYYPDGTEKGLPWARKTYFLKAWGEYYESPEQAIKEIGGFVQDGKIWTFGKISFTNEAPRTTKVERTFSTPAELKKLLDDLVFKYSMSLSDYVDLGQAKSLYDTLEEYTENS